MFNVETMKTVAKKALVILKDKSPTICVVAGCIGSVAAIALTVKSSLKLNEVVDKHEENIESIKMTMDNFDNEEVEMPEDYTMEDAKKELVKEYVSFGVDIAKTYAPTIIVESVSLAAIIYSHTEMVKRNLALGTALTAVTTAFRTYRKHVIDTYGEEVDNNFRHNVKTEIVETVDENGEVKVEEVTTESSDDPYTVLFDECNLHYEKDFGINQFYIKSMENFWNQKLKCEKDVFLNDVLRSMDLPLVECGQMVGWHYDPDDNTRDSFIDFGLYNSKAKRFKDGDECAVWLTFNCDGYIMDKVFPTVKKGA